MKNLLNWIVFFSVISFIGCSVAKKNQRAVNRVKADINLLNDVGDAWQKLNPCYPDTIRIGHTITIIDSSYAKQSIEDLNNIISSLLSKPNQNIDSLKEEIRKEVQKKCNPIIIHESRVDTLPADKRSENVLKSQLETANIKTANLEGQVVELKLQNKDLTKANRIKLIWMIAEGLGILLLIIVVLRFIFTPKLK